MASPADLCRLISDVSMVPTRSLTPSQCEYPLADPPFEHTLVANFFFSFLVEHSSLGRPGWVVHKLCAQRAIYDESELKRADLWPGPAIPLRWAHSMSNCVWRFPSDIDTPHGCHSTFRKWYRICAAQRAFHSNLKEENDDPIAVAKGTGCKFSFLLICSSVLCVSVCAFYYYLIFFFLFALCAVTIASATQLRAHYYNTQFMQTATSRVARQVKIMIAIMDRFLNVEWREMVTVGPAVIETRQCALLAHMHLYSKCVHGCMSAVAFLCPSGLFAQISIYTSQRYC